MRPAPFSWLRILRWPFWLQNVAFVLLGIPAAIQLGEYTSNHPALLQQTAILLIILMPAFLLASSRSTYLMPYIVFIWMVGPEIRRLADWSIGQFSQVNVLSLAPLLTTGMLLVALAKQPIRLEGDLLRLLKAYLIPFLYAAALGLVLNKMAGFYSAAEYFIPVLIIIVLAVDPPSAETKDRWIRIYVTLAVLLSIYGWFQYLVLPPWDLYWMESVNMISLGKAEPMGFRVFSTLNSTGPLAVFVVSALIPAVVNKKWRGPFGMIGIPLMVSALALTLVRSCWITLIVGVIAYLLFGSSANRWRMTMAVAVLTIAGFLVFPLLPGGDSVSSRVSTIGSLESDQSANARAGLVLYAIPEILKRPYGAGFGSIGRSTTLNGSEAFAGLASVDNGYLGVFATFGLLGGILYFRANILHWRFLSGKDPSSPYRTLGLVNMIQLWVGFLFGGSLASLSAVIFWLFTGLAFGDKEAAHKRTLGGPSS